MTSFTIIENAVKKGLITYKDIVERLCETNKELADELFKQVSPAEDDPKVLRKVHKAAQVAKFREDKDAIKQAMKAYDASLKPSEPKPKRVPPVRVWTAEDKVRTKEKNAYVKSKEKEYGDDVTVADLKVLRKKWRKEYDGEHKAPKAEPDVEEEPEDEAEAAEDEAAEDAVEDVEEAVEDVVETAVEEAVEDVIAEYARQAAVEEAVETAVEAAVVEQVGLSEAEKKEWSSLKKKDRDGTMTNVEKARYKELKKKK